MFNTNVCRLCAKICDNIINIFEELENKESIDFIIKKCLPDILVTENDSKPKSVCNLCYDRLQMYNEFLDECFSANSKFDYILNKMLTLEGISKEDSQLLKQNPHNNDSSTIKIQQEGSVLVLRGSNILDQEHEKSQQVFVMLLKYKDSVPEKTIMTEVSTLDVKDIDSITFTNSSDILSKNSLIKTLDIGPENKIHNEFITKNNAFYKIEQSTLNQRRDNQSCNNNIKYEVNTRQDENQSTKSKQNEKKSYQCSICNSKFSRLSRLNSHMAFHTDIKPFACDQCDKKFATRWELTMHQRIHLRTFECEFCQKLFNARSKLERHRRTHTGERPYQCQLCDRAFGDKRNLENHFRIHTGERPFECNICCRSFSVRTHLNEHKKVHTKATPFQCNVCDKVFRWKANYKLHLKVHS